MAPASRALGSHACHLGESPNWQAGKARLYWVDVMEREILDIGLEEAEPRRFAVPFHPAALAKADDGRQLIASDQGLHLRDLETDRLVELLPYWDSRPGTRANDGRAHPSGSYWISTMKWTFDDGCGIIWHYRAGTIHPIVTGISIPNGICFSPDGSLAYFSCSKAGKIWRLRLDPETGLPAGEREPFGDPADGGPDGAVTDADGNIWSSRWGAGAVVGFSPAGRVIGRIPLPARQTSCPAFVGDGLTQMAVTSAYENLDSAARAADPQAGRTFLVGGEAFKGRADALVKLR